MLGDAVKRLEYIVQHRPEEALTDASGEPTRAYWVLFTTTRIMSAAIGANALARELANSVPYPVDLFQVLRQHGIKKTPYDKLLQWTYNVVRAEYDADDGWDKLDELQARATEIMQWQAATRTDINKLSIDQVFAAVDEWITLHAEDIVYEFPNGWTVKKLVGPAALVREGELMHHCVKNPEYVEGVAAGEKVIYSLRDPSNKPHVTMEWLPGYERFNQMMMRDNKHPPSAEYRPMLIEFVTQAHGGNLLDLFRTGAKAHDLDLRGMNLRGVILSSVVLSGADLTGADLTGAKLIGAYLFNTVLIDADLTGAKLNGAVLVNAKLNGAKLIGTDLTDATLTGADLFGADLTNAIFGKFTIMPDGTDWSPPAGLGYYRRGRLERGA